MADNNNAFNPAWYPPEEKGESPGTRDWKKLTTEYVWGLRNTAQNISQTVQQFNQNITETITKITNESNNNGTPNAPVIYGTHALRLTAAYSPPPSAGYIYVETDRFQAAYYSNGTEWVLIEGTGAGSFENRYTGLNSFDAGMEWVETSRSNLNGIPPYPFYRWDGNNWAFLSGAFYRNQSQLAALAATFVPANSNSGNDVGALVKVTDFHHELQWFSFNGTGNANGSTTFTRVSGNLFSANNSWAGFPLYVGSQVTSIVSVANNNSLTAGNNLTSANNVAWRVTAWAWGPNDDLRAGEGPIAREVDPFPLTGWQLYDGSNNVSYLKSDGFTANVNLANLTSSNNVAFLEFGNLSSGNNIVPPVAPLLTMNNYTPTGNISGGGGGNATTASANEGNLGSFTYVDSVSFGGDGTFVGDAANLTGNISNNGQPPSIIRRPWFRK